MEFRKFKLNFEAPALVNTIVNKTSVTIEVEGSKISCQESIGETIFPVFIRTLNGSDSELDHYSKFRPLHLILNYRPPSEIWGNVIRCHIPSGFVEIRSAAIVSKRLRVTDEFQDPQPPFARRKEDE